MAKRRLGWLLIFCVILSGCEALLFYPMKPLLRTPTDLGLAYEDVHLHARDGTSLHAWWLPAVGEPQATVLFAHGNAENISTHIASVSWLPALKVNVLLLDYRGYGASRGVPSVSGAIQDVQAALDFLNHPAKRPLLPVVVLGQSLGASLAGVAVATGGENHCARLQRWPALSAVVLDAGFTGYADIASDVAAGHPLTYLFQKPAAWSMPGGLDLRDAVADISPLSLLIFHGLDDDVVSIKHGRALMRAAAEPKQLHEYNGGHIETFTQAENRERLLGFITASLRRNNTACR